MRTSLTITFNTERPCMVVYSPDMAVQIIRESAGTVASVIESVTEWFGTWDAGRRRMSLISETDVTGTYVKGHASSCNCEVCEIRRDNIGGIPATPSGD